MDITATRELSRSFYRLDNHPKYRLLYERVLQSFEGEYAETDEYLYGITMGLHGIKLVPVTRAAWDEIRQNYQCVSVTEQEVDPSLCRN